MIGLKAAWDFIEKKDVSYRFGAQLLTDLTIADRQAWMPIVFFELGLPFSSGPIFSIQQQAALGTRPHRACTLPPAPAGFVPVAEPRSPLAGLHWADGFPAAPQPTQQLSAATSAAAPFLSAGSQTLPPLDAGFSSAFKPMELEQEVSPLWDAEAEAGPQPWYFGSGLDLTVLALPKVAHMDCSSNAAATVCADDDDEIPLLNLDLGGGWAAAAVGAHSPCLLHFAAAPSLGFFLLLRSALC